MVKLYPNSERSVLLIGGVRDGEYVRIRGDRDEHTAVEMAPMAAVPHIGELLENPAPIKTTTYRIYHLIIPPELRGQPENFLWYGHPREMSNFHAMSALFHNYKPEKDDG